MTAARQPGLDKHESQFYFYVDFGRHRSLPIGVPRLLILRSSGTQNLPISAKNHAKKSGLHGPTN
jgi:hypothetical protein